MRRAAHRQLTPHAGLPVGTALSQSPTPPPLPDKDKRHSRSPATSDHDESPATWDARKSHGPADLARLLVDRAGGKRLSFTAQDVRRFRTEQLVSSLEACEADVVSEHDPDFDEDLAESRSPSIHTQPQITGIGRDREKSVWNVRADSVRADCAPLLLRLCGVLQWAPVSPELRGTASERPAWMTPSAMYQWLVLGLMSVACGFCLESLFATRAEAWRSSMCYGAACLRVGLLSDLPLVAVGIFGLLALGAHSGSMELERCNALLRTYAQRQGLESEWRRQSRLDLACTLVIWLCAVVERARGSGALAASAASELDAAGVAQVAAFAIIGFVVTGLTYTVLYVCRALAVMVDELCYGASTHSDLRLTIREWNVLQALLRKSSDSIQHCFFLLQLVVPMVFLLAVTDAMVGGQGIPGFSDETEAMSVAQVPAVLMTVSVLRILFCAASITDKCTHVPAIINSLSFGGSSEEIDVERQYVVTYIQNSLAGFYVFEVRLTTKMAVTYSYLIGASSFAMATQILSNL